ncbi:MAG TPA: alpha-hydroxy-acid oxidizing protein, partial [Methylomirabilota bacterium]|nr:alpha-hydroxy-acid oxidizing protein [Methylomirabilota bacterium]
GGFNRGTDIVKGLARGAKLVACGRTSLWGLAADGAEGVACALGILRHEIQTTMGLCGRTKIAELTPDLVFRVD